MSRSNGNDKMLVDTQRFEEQGPGEQEYELPTGLDRRELPTGYESHEADGQQRCEIMRQSRHEM